MDFQLSCTSHLPWIWVIETLAHSDQVDISLLLDLLEKAPEISNDVGRNAREVVSLKILERFFIQGTPANPVSSASYEKIKLDPCDNCEDVLQRILAEKCQPTSPSCLKLDDLEMKKWDLQPFIQHKRASLATYTLKQLKDAILTGKNSFIASLREQSGLSVGNQHDHEARMDGGICNGITPRLERSTTGENLLSVNGKRRVCSENAEGTSCENLIVAKNGSVKKHKHDVICGEQHVGDKYISSGVDNTSAVFMELNEGERHNLGRMNHVRIDGPTKCDNDEHTSPKGLVSCDGGLHPEKEQGQDNEIEKASGDKEGFCDLTKTTETQEADNISSDRGGSNDDGADFATKNSRQDQILLADTTKRCNDERCSLGEKDHVEVMAQSGCAADHNNERGDDEVLPREEQAPCRGTDMPNDKFDEKQMQDHEVDSDKLKQNVPRNVPNVCEAEGVNISSDSEAVLDEKTSIDTKKRTFLSSQCTYSPESLATIDWTELNLCMKCSKGGDLLVCSSDSCPIVIHVSCLGSDPAYDSNGKFYCPFCAYSHAILKYMKIKKETSLARKNLATFISGGTQKESKEQSHRSCRIMQNHREPDDGLHGNYKMKSNVAEQVCNRQRRKESEHDRAGPSVLCSENILPSRGKATTSTNVTTDLNKDKNKQEGKRTIKVSQPWSIHGKQQADELGNHKSLEENTLSQVSKRRDTSENHTNIRPMKEARSPPETESSHEQNQSSNSESVDWVETSDEEDKSKSSGASTYRTRVQKRKPQYSHPAIPLLRRKVLPWTAAEENALLDGVRLLSNPGNKVMPWTKILEFGTDIFDKSRTTVDLKDKWRNMCRAGSKI